MRMTRAKYSKATSPSRIVKDRYLVQCPVGGDSCGSMSDLIAVGVDGLVVAMEFHCHSCDAEFALLVNGRLP